MTRYYSSYDAPPTFEDILDNSRAELFWSENTIGSISTFRDNITRETVNINDFWQDFAALKNKNKNDYHKLAELLYKLPAVPYLFFMQLIACNTQSNPYFKIFINEKFQESFTQIESNSNLTVFASTLHYCLIFNKENFLQLTQLFPDQTIKIFMNKKNIHNKHFVRFFSESTVHSVLEALSSIGLTKEQIHKFVDLLKSNPSIKATSAIEKTLLEESVEKPADSQLKKAFKV